ncbi:14553_t:CDS:2 [Cetraspora pellucida]|uniref:14553_t:CDS:1 n=1 Tax=Cetraspora pellucida TaxID=1433469 RepID=A0A9N8WD27_9GLOM|nr:14553_t:CDS:2 [Cetraspora pellucida]
MVGLVYIALCDVLSITENDFNAGIIIDLVVSVLFLPVTIFGLFACCCEIYFALVISAYATNHKVKEEIAHSTNNASGSNGPSAHKVSEGNVTPAHETPLRTVSVAEKC